MEKRKGSLNSLKLCRFCLTENETLRSLYDRSRSTKSSVPLPVKIMSCVSIEVYPSDKMPSLICNRCRFFMELYYEYKQICRQANDSLMLFVQSGMALEHIEWPPSLVKMFRYGAKQSSEVGVVKTVVEGGATVEVTSHNISDSEEEDENVYNVKIEDGSDEGSSACIKVVTSKDNQHTAKEKGRRDKDAEDEPTEEVPARRSSDGVSDGCWSCDDCNSSYPLQQLLELHKMQKHRIRTVPCDQCDSMFFNKSDLVTHQLRHSEKMSYECSACGRTFKRISLLKRHENLIHPDLPQQRCPRCPATFLSLESLAEHEKTHTKRKWQTLICTLCSKIFSDKRSLQRHKAVIHETPPSLSCEYCPERFSSVSKLTSHVRSHAGDRTYPCKYCNKRFIKSHHCTRHIRLKHRETNRSPRGPFGMHDQFRCDQCEDSFGSQDELIYHSAIHATRNLICPLCQEKFENVDAVTAHIKSHVNGVEFMCDLCELVFTSKAKLEAHVAFAHDDELRQELGQDESSMEMDAVEEDDLAKYEDDGSIKIKEEDDHMVIEINQADNFMLPDTQSELEEKLDNTNSEDIESTYMELSTVDTLAMVKKVSSGKATIEKTPTKSVPATITPKASAISIDRSNESQTASILRKAEEMKRRAVQHAPEPAPEKKDKPQNKPENSGGASDKSLRLLEKELQELQRTNTRNDTPKTMKVTETIRSSRRPQLHTSTPKLRSVDEKKSQVMAKLQAKAPERRAVKENKEPKEGSEAKTNSREDKAPKEEKAPKEDKASREEKAPKEDKISKEEKSSNSSIRDDKEKEAKNTPKSVIKNGASDTSAEEGVRRSTRPSKIRDYAKMIRDRSQTASEDDDSDDSGDEEYTDSDKATEVRGKARRVSIKPPPKVVKTPVPGARKRGRPRKNQSSVPIIPVKIKKENEEIEEMMTDANEDRESDPKPIEKPSANNKAHSEAVGESGNSVVSKPTNSEQKLSSVLVSPSGQTLKKVPIRSLPPGIKPLPLPPNARTMGPGELCEMQIGKKMVKVQKIVMTKAEVEAMAKKGLLELKDGTMVLKQGIKLPTSDPVTIKSTLVGEEVGNESPTKKDTGTPSRCTLDGDA